MLRNRALFCALLMFCSSLVAAAERRPAGKSETLACRLGTEDRHARIAVVVIGGKTDSFAYYSKWKPRTCSIYLQRHRDTYSKWADNGNITTVNLERGAFLIEHKAGEYHFIFRDIDRERYCGMDGVINGSLIIRRGSDQCQLEGDIMVEGTPLGQAHAKVEREEPGASIAPSATAVPTVPGAPTVSTVSTVRSAPTASGLDTGPGPIPTRRATDADPTPASPPQSAESPPAGSASLTQPDTPPSPVAQPDVAQNTRATSPPSAAGAEKAAETPSGNPFRSFFRSLTQQRPPEPQAP